MVGDYGCIWTHINPPHVDHLSKVILVHGTYEGWTFTTKNQGISVLLSKSMVYQPQQLNSQFL